MTFVSNYFSTCRQLTIIGRQLYSVFEGHADAITAIAFTHDSRYLVTACNEGTWRLFDTLDEKNGSEALMVCDASHDLGVQGCDFSPTPGSLMCSACRKNTILIIITFNVEINKLI